MALEADVGPSLTWRLIVLKCGVEGMLLVFIIGRIKPLTQVPLSTKVTEC